MKRLKVVGLICNLLGAGVIAVGVMASRATIDRVMASLYSGPNPAAQTDRRKQSRFAILGLGLLCIGLRATDHRELAAMTIALATALEAFIREHEYTACI
jgi:hypothetical protein